MAGDQNRGPGGFRHGSDKAAHFLHPCRVQTIGRLVQDQQLWAAQQGHGDAQPLLHAQGVLPHRSVGVRGQADDIQYPANVPVIHTLQIRNDFQVFPGGQVQVAGGRLNEAAGLPQQGDAILFVHGLPQQLHLPAGLVDQSQEHFHAGGLPCPIWPKEAVDATLGNGEGQAFYHSVAAVALCEIVGFDNRFHSCHSLFQLSFRIETGYHICFKMRERPD